MKEVSAFKKNQGGFTMIELVVVLAIVALVIGFAARGLFQSKEDAKVQTAQNQLMKDYPSAIIRLVTLSNQCNNTSITKDKLISRGISEKTVWGTDWSVTTTGGNRATITYALDVKDADAGPNLATALAASDNIVSATGTASSVVVTYYCN